MKFLLFFLLIFNPTFVSASSIAVYPPVLEWQKIEQKTVVIMNPEKYSQEFQISSPEAGLFSFYPAHGTLPSSGSTTVQVTPLKLSSGVNFIYVSTKNGELEPSIAIKTRMSKPSLFTGAIVGALSKSPNIFFGVTALVIIVGAAARLIRKT
ncbi:MAG: hypothetical protein AABX51_05860 [Nanoarchaeota archaeon]